MILSDREIEQGVLTGDIVISPYTSKNLGPNSYDLTLGPTLMVYTSSVLDARKQNPTKSFTITEQGYLLQPGTLYLGHTLEAAGSHRYAPMVEGRSSYGRLGLDVHISAGFGDVGFAAVWTLEMRVIHPLVVYPGERICQIYFHEVKGEVLKPYRGKYANSTSVEASKVYTELEKK